LKSNLPRERLSIAVTGVAAAQAAVDWTLEYVKQRRAFGKPIGAFQNSRFVLAQAHTEVQVAQAFLDQCIARLVAKELSAEDAAMAKMWCSEMQGRVIDQCLQLHGGYGYMLEYPIATAFLDARVSRIYGGTTEIMREIVGRSLGLK
jgi:alkylation response protein AidB-like acyl-CoA dehydrogenase